MPRQDFLGKCEVRKGVRRSSDDLVEQEILISLAGLAAESRLTGTYNLIGAGKDLRHVRSLALNRTGPRAVQRYERRMLAKVEYLLTDDELWTAVELIAKELLIHGTISGRAAVHFFEEAKKQA